VLTWDLIDHLNLATTGQTSTSLNACSATLYVRSALTTPMVIVKDALMDITYQEQLATSVMLTVQPVQEAHQHNVPDAQRDTIWMLPQTAPGLKLRTQLEDAGLIVTKMLLVITMF